MTKTANFDILTDLLDRAKKAGADAADALYIEGDAISHAQRLGEIERLERSEGQDLGLRVFVGQQAASVSTSEFTPDALQALAERAVAMAREVPPDPHTGIAPKDRLATNYPDIDIDDPEEPAPEALIARARACEDSARAVAGVTNSEGAEASWGRSRVFMATSNGFLGEYSRSSHTVWASVIAGEGLGMQTDYDFATAVYGSDLEDPDAVGDSAGHRAVRLLNPKKVKSAQVPVVFEPRVANGLVSHLASAINGAAVARGTSFLKDKLGEQVCARGITIVDDPHRKRGLRSKPFDGEGIANRRRNLVEDGVLTTWLLDLRSAKQLGLESTGHAARGLSGPPSPSATNLYLEPGEHTAEAMIADIDQGLYVTGMIGASINMMTGDYSRGAYGFWIEKGEIAYPVSEITVAGNLKDMFLNMTPASDLRFRYGTDAPTVRVDGMTVAGN